MSMRRRPLGWPMGSGEFFDGVDPESDGLLGVQG